MLPMGLANLNPLETLQGLMDKLPCGLLLTFLICAGLTVAQGTSMEPYGGWWSTEKDLINVVNGEEAPANGFPWVVALKNLKTGWRCSGTLISSRYVLTAAHCLFENRIDDRSEQNCKNAYDRVSRGPVSWQHWTALPLQRCSSGRSGCRESWYPVTKVDFHDEFDLCNYEDDLALLTLADPVPGGQGRPACLPGTYEPLSGKLTMTGAVWTYGVVDVHTLSVLPLESSNRQIVTLAYAGGGICDGESGAPLLQTDRHGRFTVVGIMSRGFSCEHEGSIDWFTDVRHYIDWICGRMSLEATCK
ncbi:hypothetical protein Q1695_007567 [Nippostrongylus brasiliensis]|nr:hypothetical protein Q1695_007567 [Nippostrongylus brasiliensis]